jgi:hypothetical protein
MAYATPGPSSPWSKTSTQSERLGHSTVAITLGIYSQVSPTLHGEAAESIGVLILG